MTQSKFAAIAVACSFLFVGLLSTSVVTAQSGSRNVAPQQNFAPVQNVVPQPNFAPAPVQNFAPTQQFVPAPQIIHTQRFAPTPVWNSSCPSSSYRAPRSSYFAPRRYSFGNSYAPLRSYRPFYGRRYFGSGCGGY